MWVCTRHPSAQLTGFPAFSSTGGTGKCHYLFRGQVFGFHDSMMRLRNAESWSILDKLGVKSTAFLGNVEEIVGGMHFTNSRSILLDSASDQRRARAHE
jgi:hypothetical protein